MLYVALCSHVQMQPVKMNTCVVQCLAELDYPQLRIGAQVVGTHRFRTLLKEATGPLLRAKGHFEHT